jgi:hypothetical protein
MLLPLVSSVLDVQCHQLHLIMTVVTLVTVAAA